MTTPNRESKVRAVGSLQHTLMENERNILQAQAVLPALSQLSVNEKLPSSHDLVTRAVQYMAEAARMIDLAITIETSALQGRTVEVASKASGTVLGK